MKLTLAVVSFCGVVVPYNGLPSFWQSWMYWLTPFKYLLEGFLALLVTGQEIRCEPNEMAIFPPPPGQDCQTYAGQFAQQSGGYVETQPDGLCGFCQYSSGDAFAASFNVFPQYIWRDFGMYTLTVSSGLSLLTQRHQVSCGPTSSSTSQSCLSVRGCIWVVSAGSSRSSAPVLANKSSKRSRNRVATQRSVGARFGKTRSWPAAGTHWV